MSPFLINGEGDNSFYYFAIGKNNFSATLSTSYNPAASLYKTTVTDEDGKTSIEFKDKNGNVVLQRNLISGTSYADTYYCYDHLGNLLWVVTPQGSSSLTASASYTFNHSISSQYSYIYAYNGRNHLIEKKQPGKDIEHYARDKAGRETLYQDGNLRLLNQYISTTYNNINRISRKLLIQAGENSLDEPQLLLSKTLYSAMYYGYNNNYEDDPTDNPTQALPFAATSTVTLLDLAQVNHGELKYEKHLLLNADTDDQYKETAYYYNSRGELLQTVTKYPDGNILRTSYRYDFTGNIITKEETCNGVTKLTAYIYNNRGQLIADSTTLNNGSPASVVYSYDDLGRVTQRTLGNGIVETQEYNIQGWLTQVAAQKGSANIYNQTLRYYNPTKGTAALYSGNISEWSSQQASQQQETYGFTYDLQGRLTGSNRYSGTSTSAQSSYTERGITYDKNGNILTLQRYAAALQDNYSYTYNGNKVTSISGTNNGTAISAATYSYDNNGNTTTDGLKNLQITYNILNLPQSVTQSGSTKATYGWFADGTKYSVLDAQGNGYYYIGSLIYSSTEGTTALESTDFSSGRIVLSGNTQTIHYHHKDHLGSVRAITDGSGSTIEQNAYYPFGGRHTFGQTYAQTTANRYKFNGKELQTTGNLNLLDYGARMYDAKIARWLVQDLLAEKLVSVTPYRFSLNNPISYTDPEGLFETRKEAREYRRENDNVTGRITKNHDGSFSIIDNKNSIVYTKVSSELNSTDEDFIDKAILVTPYTNNENSIIQAIYDAQSGFINNPLVSSIAGTMVTMMFPEVSVAYKSFIPAKSAITKSSLKYGQYMHRLYHLGEEGKEYSKIKGIRPDFVEVKTRTIYELKPNNPRAIKRGHKQLETYKKRFEQEYGGEWNTVLDLY